MPLTTQPISIPSPDVPYSLLAVQISTVPQVRNNAVSNAISIIGRRYRVLDSGPDFAPMQQWVKASAAAGSDFSNAIVSAIHTYLIAKSISNADFPNAGIQLFIAPKVLSGEVTGSADLIVRWYASPASFAPQDQWHRESYPDIFAAAENDADLATAVATILSAVQAFVTAGGY